MANAVHIVGGGLAGCEAAFQLARVGVPVILHEMRPERMTEAHVTAHLAELVCSNSLRSDDAAANAVGLLHAEMRLAGSLVMRSADANQVPAGGALAVDREGFSKAVEAALAAEPLIRIERAEVAALPLEDWQSTIIASGPLTSPGLAESIKGLTGSDALAFFDAIAPIVERASVDMEKAWLQSRYDKEGPAGDAAAYINCPLDKAEYQAFIAAVLAGEKTAFKEFEANTPYFEGCLPIEVMAERGPETLRFGPMKPVGLTNPHKAERPYAVVQLRQDNKLGTIFNLVGFQTKLKYGAQERIFRMIPGLERAVFARFGGLHRNSFIDSPRLLDSALRLKMRPALRFAGQITGVEGYVESAAMGLLAGRFTAAERAGQALVPPPATTAHGALLAHITGGHLSDAKGSFQPMNVNFGLFPPLESEPQARGRERGLARKRALSARALSDFAHWLAPGARRVA